METVEVDYKNSMRIINPESHLAHRYLDGLSGIEIGAAAYQPFGLDTINISTGDKEDRKYYKNVQLAVCGRYVTVDIEAEANDLPCDDNSVDFLIASHVFEHLSDPISALVEWNRVVKPGGFLFLIVPKRDNLQYGDSMRDITPLSWYNMAYRESWSNETAYQHMWDRPSNENADRMRGHVWVFSLLSLCGLVSHVTNELYYTEWELVEAHETDDTTGEGHMALFRKAQQ